MGMVILLLLRVMFLQNCSVFNKSNKTDKNSNFAVICHKQDLWVFIPIYNEKKIRLSQLRCTSVLIRMDLWHIIDQNEKH